MEESSETKQIRWTDIALLPPGLLQETLMRFTFESLAAGYRSKDSSIVSVLSNVEFWMQKLVATHLLPPGKGTEWLKIWVGTPEADKMIDSFWSRVEEPYYKFVRQLVKWCELFKDSSEISKINVNLGSEIQGFVDDVNKSIQKTKLVNGKEIRAIVDISHLVKILTTLTARTKVSVRLKMVDKPALLILPSLSVDSRPSSYDEFVQLVLSAKSKRPVRRDILKFLGSTTGETDDLIEKYKDYLSLFPHHLRTYDTLLIGTDLYMVFKENNNIRLMFINEGALPMGSARTIETV